MTRFETRGEFLLSLKNCPACGSKRLLGQRAGRDPRSALVRFECGAELVTLCGTAIQPSKACPAPLYTAALILEAEFAAGGA